MKDFVSFVKNTSTEEFIKFWGEMSIKIYQKQLKNTDKSELRPGGDFLDVGDCLLRHGYYLCRGGAGAGDPHQKG